MLKGDRAAILLFKEIKDSYISHLTNKYCAKYFYSQYCTQVVCPAWAGPNWCCGIRFTSVAGLCVSQPQTAAFFSIIFSVVSVLLPVRGYSENLCTKFWIS